MSASFGKDTRRFYILPLLIAATLAFSPSLSKAETPEVPAGLFDALSDLDLAAVLNTILPNEIVPGEGFNKNAMASAQFDLAQYMRNNVDPRAPKDVLAQIPKYQRAEMFGTWVNENPEENCYNTRAEVMIRDATPGTKVIFSKFNPCQVYRGTWHDPYTGTTYKLANAIQIDHVVPLKNAYRSGAHAWTRERRCHYANFLNDVHHLLAVSGHENMSKGDSGPEDYIPPDSSFTCEYLHNWMRVKAIWNLTYSEKEREAVEVTMRDLGCSVATTRVTLPEMTKIRAMTTKMNVKCVDEDPLEPRVFKAPQPEAPVAPEPSEASSEAEVRG